MFFCPFSKNSRPPSKKLKPIFGQKLNAMEATLNIKKKTQKVLIEKSRIYSKVHGIFNKFVEFSKYWINFCGIFQKTMNFSENLQILKKTQGFFQKNSRIWKKLKVLEAMCLRLPPKNWAKKGPATETFLLPKSVHYSSQLSSLRLWDL